MANLICDDLCMTFTNPQTGGKVEALKDINFTLKKGEILGVSGLVGAGRTEMAEAIFGARTITSGELFLDGKKINNKNLRMERKYKKRYFSNRYM